MFNSLSMPAYAQAVYLPKPGQMVPLTKGFTPVLLKGIKIDPDNPLRLEFLVAPGDNNSVILKPGDNSVILSEAKDPKVNNKPLDPSVSRPLVGIPQDDNIKAESRRLIKYFLAALTVPEKDLWVNLSPYEKDRIIPQVFGQTEMGRDLLAQDYLLKQVTASLIYPEKELGREFWKRVYAQAQAKFGTTDIPVNTFNKVWIVPDKAEVYESGILPLSGEGKGGGKSIAYVVESTLKVMLEQDYLALSRHPEGAKRPKDLKVSLDSSQPSAVQNDVNSLASKIIKDIVLPQLQKEVNEGKSFAPLRQVYHSLILAAWYKQKIKDSILAKVYADKNKVAGVGYDHSVILKPESNSVILKPEGLKDLNVNNKPLDPSGVRPQDDDVNAIYHQYLQAFKKGVFNYIKDTRVDYQTTPRKYFSGGMDLMNITPHLSYAMTVPAAQLAGPVVAVSVDLQLKPSPKKDEVKDEDKALRGKHFVVLDDNEEVVNMYHRLLSDHVLQENIKTGLSPQDGLTIINELRKQGIADENIVVLTDFQFKGRDTASPLIDALRGRPINELLLPDDWKGVFLGPILIVSGSLIDKRQSKGFDPKRKGFDPEATQQHGIDFFEKSGELEFRAKLLAKIRLVAQRKIQEQDLTKESISRVQDDPVAISEELNYFKGGINDLELRLGGALDQLRERLDYSLETGPLIKQIQERAEFARAKPGDFMEYRTHAYGSRLAMAISESLDDLKTKVSALGLGENPRVQESLDQVQKLLTQMLAYAKFLNQLFFHMRGLQKLNAFQSLLQAAIGQYNHESGAQPDAQFDPQVGIAIVLDELQNANDQMQRGAIEDAMMDWGRVFLEYKNIQKKFDPVLAEKMDHQAQAFMRIFSKKLNEFFGQYLERFGHTHLRKITNGAVAGRLVIIEGNKEPDALLRELEQVEEGSIVVMDFDDTFLSIIGTKAAGFIGGEGAGHLATRAHSLHGVGVPMVILPNAVEYLKQFKGQDKWVSISSEGKDGTLRFVPEKERGNIPLLQRKPIAAKSVEPDYEGPLIASLFNDREQRDLTLEQLERRMGPKAANVYFNRQKLGLPAPDTKTLQNRFFKELLENNPVIAKELHKQLDAINKKDITSVMTHLAKMQELVKGLGVSPEMKKMIWESVEGLNVPNLILRLSTGAEDLRDFPGVGAGRYGTKELIPWADENGHVSDENKENLIKEMLGVYASFWSFNAYMDREQWGIEHWSVGQALPIQEYLEDSTYSVHVETADTETRNTNVIKIRIAPGSGRTISASDREVGGLPLTVYYDKNSGKVIGPDDPRKDYRPVMLKKTRMSSFKTGEIVDIDLKLYPELGSWSQIERLALSVIKDVTAIEEAHGQAQDIEGVIEIKKSDGYAEFTHVQSRALGGGFGYYRPGHEQEQQRARMRTALIGWLDQYGRESFKYDPKDSKNPNFYHGRAFESPSLQNFIPKLSDFGYELSLLVSELLDKVCLTREIGLEHLMPLYHLLLDSDEFEVVREGLLRRIFFYAASQHALFMSHFIGLEKEDPQLFLKVFPYAVMPMNAQAQEHYSTLWLEKVNGWLAVKVWVTLSKASDWDMLVRSLPAEVLISLVHQAHFFEGSRDLMAQGQKENLEERLYELLPQHSQYPKILQGLNPKTADRVQAAIKKAQEEPPLPPDHVLNELFGPSADEPESPVSLRGSEGNGVSLRDPTKGRGEAIFSAYEQEKSKFRAKIAAWVQKVGAARLQDMTFYKDKDTIAEAEGGELEKTFSDWITRGAREGETWAQQPLVPEGKHYEFDQKMDYILDILMNEDEFAAVREGVLYRLFFYAMGEHAPMINYFNSLHGRDRKLFDKAVQYFLPAIDDTKEQRFYARYNNYSVIRWLNMAGEDIVHDAVRQWSNEEIMKLLYIYNLSFQLENMNSPEMNQEVLEQIFLVLNERGLVQEALSKLQGQAFDKLKSVASQPVLLYEPTRAAVRKKIVALVNQEGVANIQSREFYAGTYYREIDSTLSSYSGSYSSVLRLLMPRDKQYSFEEQMDSVLEVLLYDPAFEPVREGLLYRLFYYLNGLPAEMIGYFKVLQGRKSEVFNKVMHYIIPAFPEEGAVSFLIRGSNFWFNQWLNQEREEIIRLAVHQWSKKDVIRLFNAHNRALETQKENQLHPVVIQQIARVLQEQNRLQEILSMVTGRAHDDLQAAADKAMSAQQQQRAFSLKELWLDYGELFDRLKHLDYLVVERGYSAAREQDRDNRANLEKEFTLRREAFIRRFILEGAFTWTDRQEAVNYLRQVLDQTPVYLFNASADEKDAEFKKLEPLLLKILNKPIRVSPAPKARPTLTFADVLMGQKSSGLWQAVSKENSQITEGVFGEPVEIYGEGEREKVLAEVQKQMGRVRDQELVYLAVDVKFWNMVDHIVVIEQASVIRSNLERIIQFHTPSNSDTVKLNEFIFYLNFTQFGLPGNGKGKIYLRKMSVGRDRTEIFTLDKLKAQQDPQSQKGLGTETFENWVKALQGKFHGWTVLAVDGSPRLAPPGNPDDRLPGDGQTWLAHRFNQLLGGVRHVQDESVLGFIRQYGERVSSDEAVDGMVLAGTVPQASNEEAPAGGIDLSVVNVQQSGDTSEAFHFDDATLRQLQEGFEGFDIKIIRVSPVTDLSLYLGLGK